MHPNLKLDYCCSFIRDITEQLPWELGYSITIPIKYSPCRRLYLLQLCPRYPHQGGQKEDMQLLEGIPLKYCPHCGKRLPLNLAETRFKILKTEFNIDLARDIHAAIPPKEFLTDEWWKKRGL